MELSAEAAKTLAMHIAAALDKISELPGATAVLQMNHPANQAIGLVVVITVNPFIAPELVKFVKSHQELGTLRYADHAEPRDEGPRRPPGIIDAICEEIEHAQKKGDEPTQ